MARQRRFLQRLRSDGRWFVQVADRSQARVYLGTKDRSRAEQIGRFIYLPWSERNLAEVKRRVRQAKLLGDRLSNVVITEQQLTDLGRGGYSDEILSEPQLSGAREIFTDFDRSEDADRNKLEDASSLIAQLLERDDLLSELLVEAVQVVEAPVLREVQKAIDKRLKTKSKSPLTPERLSDCVKVWKDRLEAEGRTPQHIQEYEAVFNSFVELVGNLHLSELEKDHFVAWQNHVDATRGERGKQWTREQLLPVGAVLRKARKFTSWSFPAELTDWLSIFEYSKAKPHKNNRQPLTVEAFNKLLAQADEWANLDVQEYAAQLNAAKKYANERLAESNNIKQALRVKRKGTQFAAILRLAVNAGCDNKDISLITYEDLRLDGKLPLFTLTRNKTKVDRFTPLLPSTVAAIKRWREYEEPKTDRVFSNDAKRPFDSSKLSENFRKLCQAAGVTACFKHLRNVGATVGRNARRPRDEREAFLGHEVHGQCVFYEGDYGEDYLVELVNAIGAEYFGGEQIAPAV